MPFPASDPALQPRPHLVGVLLDGVGQVYPILGDAFLFDEADITRSPVGFKSVADLALVVIANSSISI
ncbi:uncharacterized protein METZ01_LOCUS7616 [marine metagenome]|uniref:Uncharacterized protein n=1 Tax=marine metagenome TaxID=408172 RepID=A0A381NJH3_9ZZZZ